MSPHVVAVLEAWAGDLPLPLGRPSSRAELTKAIREALSELDRLNSDNEILKRLVAEKLLGEERQPPPPTTLYESLEKSILCLNERVLPLEKRIEYLEAITRVYATFRDGLRNRIDEIESKLGP